MKWAERQHYRLMVDAAARQLTRGKDADSALFAANLVDPGMLRHDRPQRFSGANLRIASGSGRVAERASPRCCRLSITTQLKVLPSSIPASIATQNRLPAVRAGH